MKQQCSCRTIYLKVGVGFYILCVLCLFRNDSKEGERKKLAQLFRSYSVQYASRTGGVGPQVWMLDLQVRFSRGVASGV